MLNGKRVFRWTLSACLAVVLGAAGVGLYQMNTKEQAVEPFPEDGMEAELSAEVNETYEEWIADVDAEPVESTQEEVMQEVEESSEPADAAPAVEETAASTAAEPVFSFTEESLMEWPVNGEIVLDYSMDKTVYYQTLDLYKYSPAIVVSAEVNTPVLAAASGQVLSVASNEETGVTVTLDMGNGYQAVYGQLKEVAFAEGDTVESGTIIGYVSEPTKYYCKEGANLYFAMTKDGAAVDPLLYLP